MKKKLNSKFMLIAAIAILVTAVCSIGLFYSILVQQIYDDLKANAHVISRLDFEDASQKVCDQLSEDGLRITLIATDGTVLYDSMEDETKMEGKAAGCANRRLPRSTHSIMRCASQTEMFLESEKRAAASTIWHGI